MLALLFRQRAQRGLEAREPLGVVVDAVDVVAGVDEPVHEDVQRDSVVVRVHHVEGPEAPSAVASAAERGDGLGDEVDGQTVVVRPWSVARGVASA